MTIAAITRFIVALTLVGYVQFGRAATPTLTPAEQEVIDVLLQRQGPSAVSGRVVMVEMASVSEIRRAQSYEDFAKTLRSWGFGENWRPQEVRESLEDFLAKNRLETKIVFPTNATTVQLVAPALLQEIFRTNGWNSFYQRFPGSGGYAVISRVGFDSKNTVAMVYLGVHSNYISGQGNIYILRRDNGKWTVTHEEIGPGWRM